MTAIDLIPLIGNEPEFRKAMVKLPVWERVTPNPYYCVFDYVRFRKHVQRWQCIKCGQGDNRLPDANEPQVCQIPDPFTGLLGDLAFELRDKACKSLLTYCEYRKALMRVWELDPQGYPFQEWLERKATPYHWIIAALLALETENEK